MRLLVGVALLLSATALGGCARFSVLTSTQPGQVYLLRQKPAGSDTVYSCDVRDGEPLCYRARETR